jgi:hypothetical protein
MHSGRTQMIDSLVQRRLGACREAPAEMMFSLISFERYLSFNRKGTRNSQQKSYKVDADDDKANQNWGIRIGAVISPAYVPSGLLCFASQLWCWTSLLFLHLIHTLFIGNHSYII